MIIVDNNDAGEDVFAKVWKRCMILVKKKVTIASQNHGLRRNSQKRPQITPLKNPCFSRVFFISQNPLTFVIKTSRMNIETERRGSILCTTVQQMPINAAAKIMSHEYANKYANYWSKKNKVIKTGKANFKGCWSPEDLQCRVRCNCRVQEQVSKLHKVQTSELETV